MPLVVVSGGQAPRPPCREELRSPRPPRSGSPSASRLAFRFASLRTTAHIGGNIFLVTSDSPAWAACVRWKARTYAARRRIWGPSPQTPLPGGAPLPQTPSLGLAFGFAARLPLRFLAHHRPHRWQYLPCDFGLPGMGGMRSLESANVCRSSSYLGAKPPDPPAGRSSAPPDPLARARLPLRGSPSASLPCAPPPTSVAISSL